MKPMLCTDYDSEEHDLAGWLVQEKLDGVRAMWDGNRMWSRQGKPIAVPFNLPDVALDGELWADRFGFLRVLSAINGGSWDGIKFVAFDAPGNDAIESRLARLETLRGRVEIAETRAVSDTDEAIDCARKVFTLCGEGIVAKKPGSLYTGYRTGEWVRIKPQPLIEIGEVIEHNAGQSVRVRWNGLEMNLGTKGKTIKVGQPIHFMHNGLLPSGLPRFARLA